MGSVHPAANAVANHGSVDTASLDSTMAALPASVQGRLQQIFASGSVKPDDLEPRVVLELMEFGENGACTILDRYGSKNLSAVRNKTAFLIGVVRRYREEIKNGGPASMGGGGGGMGGGGHYGGGGGGGGYGGGAAAPPANPAMVQAAQQQVRRERWPGCVGKLVRFQWWWIGGSGASEHAESQKDIKRDPAKMNTSHCHYPYHYPYPPDDGAPVLHAARYGVAYPRAGDSDPEYGGAEPLGKHAMYHRRGYLRL